MAPILGHSGSPHIGPSSCPDCVCKDHRTLQNVNILSFWEEINLEKINVNFWSIEKYLSNF